MLATLTSALEGEVVKTVSNGEERSLLLRGGAWGTQSTENFYVNLMDHAFFRGRRNPIAIVQSGN